MDEDLGFSNVDVDVLVGNKVWKRIVEDVLSRGLMLSEDNDLLDPMAQATVIARNQGEIRAIKWFIDLPRIFKEEIDDTKETKKEEEKEDGRD